MPLKFFRDSCRIGNIKKSLCGAVPQTRAMEDNMKRRSFFKHSAALGTLAGGSLLLNSYVLFPREKPQSALVDRVIYAMLPMQRLAWEQGVAAQALLEWGDKERVILMAKEAVLRQWPDGRLAVVSCNHGVTDPAANGEPVLFAAKATGSAHLKKGAEKMLEYLLNKAPRTKDGVLHHIDDKPQVWIDSLYMAPPFMAACGKFKEAVQQVNGFRKILWKPKKQLFSQIWDDGKKVFIQEKCWGVGNGWAAAGMTRIINMLPLSMETEKKQLISYTKEVINGCLAHLRSDGLFHNIVDEPGTFVETNLSQIMAYCIYRGVKGGWMEKRYLKQAAKMRAAAHAKVDKDGLVQGVCGSPNFESPGTATEGQAFFILMEAACKDLGRNER
jgi:rhamnogalacturonyl hydrolase YesR